MLWRLNLYLTDTVHLKLSKAFWQDCKTARTVHGYLSGSEIWTLWLWLSWKYNTGRHRRRKLVDKSVTTFSWYSASCSWWMFCPSGWACKKQVSVSQCERISKYLYKKRQSKTSGMLDLRFKQPWGLKLESPESSNWTWWGFTTTPPHPTSYTITECLKPVFSIQKWFYLWL